MLIVSHVWPGITPHNVWQLPCDVWLMYARAADEWSKQAKEASRGE